MNASKQNTSTENPVPTQAALRLKVAELCGWTREKDEFEHDWWRSLEGQWTHDLPDYPNDLNVCAEFEKGLRESPLRFDYFVALQDVMEEIVIQNVIFATAEQRCRAFVEVMKGKSVPSGLKRSDASGVSTKETASAFLEQQGLQQQDFKEH